MIFHYHMDKKNIQDILNKSGLSYIWYTRIVYIIKIVQQCCQNEFNRSI